MFFLENMNSFFKNNYGRISCSQCKGSNEESISDQKQEKNMQLHLMSILKTNDTIICFL